MDLLVRTPAGPHLTWAKLRRQVFLRSGRHLDLESSTADPAAVDALFEVFGVSRGDESAATGD